MGRGEETKEKESCCYLGWAHLVNLTVKVAVVLLLQEKNWGEIGGISLDFN
jgi:hypothetical protein